MFEGGSLEAEEHSPRLSKDSDEGWEAIHLHRPCSQVYNRVCYKEGPLSTVGLGAKMSTTILGTLRAEEGGGPGVKGEGAWLSALLATTSSAFANRYVVVRERRWSQCHCGS